MRIRIQPREIDIPKDDPFKNDSSAARSRWRCLLILSGLSLISSTSARKQFQVVPEVTGASKAHWKRTGTLLAPSLKSVDRASSRRAGHKSRTHPPVERGWSEFIQSRNKLSEVSLLSQTRVGEV